MGGLDEPGVAPASAGRAGATEAGGPPVVSVIVPAWNVEPWIRQCLDSVVEQSIGFDRLEVLVTDDGSTDATGRILDAYAARWPQVRVLHQANSGGPGSPRNRGLERARGTYVFFLDADDYLGPEALERMVAMADRNGSDIVVGLLVGVDGRRAYRRVGAFRENVDRADPLLVYPSGNVLKLFRRSFLERGGFRFPEGIAGGEDGDLMARAYLEAGVISVVADYPCYYARRRKGSQTHRKDRMDDVGEYARRVEAHRIRVVAAHHRAGPVRDALLVKPIAKIAAKFKPRWARLPPDERHRAFEAASGIVRRWSSPLVMAALPRWAAVRAWCLAAGAEAALVDIANAQPADAYRDAIVEGRHVYAAFPHFRDGTGIPDRCFDIAPEIVLEHRLERAGIVDGRLELAGQAYLLRLGGTTTIELRRWPRGPVLRFPAEPVATPQLRDKHVRYRWAGYRATIDLATAFGGRPLPAATWRLGVVVGTDRVTRSGPVRVGRHDQGVLAAGHRRGERTSLRLAAGRTLRLQVGPRGAATTILEALGAARWRAGRLLVRGSTRVLRTRRPGRLLELALAGFRHRGSGGASAE